MDKKFKIEIKKDDIKHFFCKKTREKGIVTKRLLGVTLTYVKGRTYADFVHILKCINSILGIDINKMLYNTNDVMRNVG